MAKPVSSFAWSTDVNYSAGPAAGQPTKVAIPSAAQGLVPGDDLIPEYINNVLNFISTYTDWVFDGSSAGAADAHIVETDSNGDTTVQTLFAVVEVESTGGNFRWGNTTGSSFLTRTGHAGTGALPGNISVIEGQAGQNQVGATANNDAGVLALGGQRPGTGGSVRDGGMGLLQLRDSKASTIAGSGTAAAAYEGFAFFDVGASATVDVRLPQVWSFDTTSMVTLECSIHSQASAAVLIQKKIFQVVSDSVGNLTITQPITNPIYENDTFTLQPDMIVIETAGGPPDFVDLRVNENDAVVIRCSVKLEIIVSPTFA